MNDKITKQHIYSELVIRLDKLEYKLDKLLAILDIPVASGSGLDRVIEQRNCIQDSEQFDEAYK